MSLVKQDVLDQWTMWDGFDEEAGCAVGGRIGYVQSESVLQDELDD